MPHNWPCRIGWHRWTPWSFTFTVHIQSTFFWVPIGAAYARSFQNRRCRLCGYQQQRYCGVPTTDHRSEQFVSLTREL